MTFTYEVTPAAPWLSFNTATLLFTGVPPDNSVAGDYSISVHAKDPWPDADTVTATFNL